MDLTRIRAMARNFHENGMKLLLEHPQNVRDLLMLAGVGVVERIELDGLTRVQQTFVERDYRHIEADVVLTAPLRGESAGRGRLWIYILIEHQSAPDRLMPLRLHDYVIQIFKFQKREWEKRHGSVAGLQFQPVLAVVFYTGERRWDAVGTLAELIAPGAGFQERAPTLDPLFLNLRAIAPEVLEARGGFFGQVLRLVKERKRRHGEFKKRLVRVIRALEAMPAEERLRWLELLSYIHALVYHVRRPAERPELRREIEASVATDADRQEVFQVGRTIADELKDEGRLLGKLETARETLVRLLRRRFGDVPEATVAIIQSTSDFDRLNGWLDRFATADTLEEVGIG